jgi:chromosome segregation ATPase
VKYLDPVRDELAQLRDAAEHWRTRSHHLEHELDLIRDTLTHRTQALNRTGESNDALRATLARVRKLVAPQWRSLGYDRNALIDDIRAALDDQETPA